MTAIHGRRERRMTAAVLTTIIALLALPLGLYIGSDALLNKATGDNVDNTIVDIPLTPAELVFVRSSRGELANIALIAIDPSGRGGTIVAVPARLAADVDEGDTPKSIADAYASGGLEAARLEVEDVLNITANTAAEVTGEQLAALLAPMGSRDVSLPAAVLDGPQATATTVLPAGASTVDAAKVAAALAAVQPDVAASKSFAQVKALWTAVAEAGTVSADDTTATTIEGEEAESIDAPSSSEGYFEALFAGRIDVWQLEATKVTDSTRNPAGADWYSLDSAETLLVMASVVPTAMSLTSNSITVMLDVPFDDTAIAKEAVLRFSYLGANVMVVRQVDDAPAETTKVFFNDIIARDEVAQYESLIGPMEFEQALEIVSGISVRVVLGNSFVTLMNTTGSPTTTVPG